jgi:hypothetical protein
MKVGFYRPQKMERVGNLFTKKESVFPSIPFINMFFSDEDPDHPG